MTAGGHTLSRTAGTSRARRAGRSGRTAPRATTSVTADTPLSVTSVQMLLSFHRFQFYNGNMCEGFIEFNKTVK